MSLWMLAADKQGKIPDDAEYLKKLCSMSEKPDLDLFIDLKFIEKRRQHDAKVTPPRRHGDAPEESREETEKSREEEERGREASASPHPFMIIPLKGQELHKIEVTQVEELKEAYPSLDVEQELRSMRQHQTATGLKTAKGINKAIQFWMRKAIELQNEARINGHKPGADPQADVGRNIYKMTGEEEQRLHDAQMKLREQRKQEVQAKP